VLHGFTGCCESVETVAEALAEDRRAIAVDLVGHGQSDAPADPAAYRMEACVAQLASALDALDAPRVHVVGYSMGGRAGLSFAVAHPDRVASLVLVGATPGLQDANARTARVRADEELARRIEDEGVESFVDAWMALPLFASQKSLGPEKLAAMRRQRLRCRIPGLVGSLRGMGTGAMPPLHDRLQDLRVPTCLVAGALDAKFAELASEMERALPVARRVAIDGVGHAAHVEDPAGFNRVVRGFLAAHENESRTSSFPQEKIA